VRFTYDLNGVLEVEALVVATNKKFTHIITRHARNLSESQIAQAVAEMQTLKTHPREETVSRFLIRRAERVYQELPLSERRILEQLISGFEEALELQDSATIARHREVLEDFLDQHDGPNRDEFDFTNDGSD
jgi:molecular chaperone HscC